MKNSFARNVGFSSTYVLGCVLCLALPIRTRRRLVISGAGRIYMHKR